MSSEPSNPPRKLHKYMVWCPDYTDEKALDRRYSVREKHLSDVKPYLNNFVKVGGMIAAPGSEKDETGQRKQAVGSILIIEAETLKEVEDYIKKDVYYTTGVWDAEKLQILPFFPATDFP